MTLTKSPQTEKEPLTADRDDVPLEYTHGMSQDEVAEDLVNDAYCAGQDGLPYVSHGQVH